MKDRITELESLITRYQKSYYDGEGEISDAEFDALWDELTKLDPENSILHRVGRDDSDGFEKRRHIIPMGSQEKAANPEEFITWASKQSTEEFLTELKLDGASIELQYENGRFTHAVTRGDGVIGDDVTNNVRKMMGLVPNLDNPFTGGIRGEVLMFHDVKNNLFKDKKNCRNAANGIMKRKDGTGSEHLTIICYDVCRSDGKNIDDSVVNEYDKLHWLQNHGFIVTKHRKTHSIQEVIAFRDETIQYRENLPFDIDGLVVKNYKICPEDMKRDRPLFQIAFKFTLEEAATRLLDVEWSVSGSTRTPIAIVTPVQLAGTTVSRANLCNTNLIKKLGIKIGSMVTMVKRGEIIPKIERVLNTPECATEIVVPTVCEFCSNQLVDYGTVLSCTNKDCSQRIIHRIEKWITTQDIQNIGPSTIQKLYDAAIVRSIRGLYKIVALPSMIFGTRNAERIINGIQDARNVTLPTLIAGYDIDGIGESHIEKLCAAGFNTFESFFNAKESDFIKVHGIGDITAHLLYEGLLEHKEEMQLLLDEGCVILTSECGSSKLMGKSFCFTGELVSMKRPHAESTVKSLGGSVKGSVVSGLTYLVTNNPNSGSSKNQKAKELGVSIIGEEEFLSIINN